jgi:hypothetical protein
MQIRTDKYTEVQKQMPQTGQRIIAHQTDDKIVVYQAYNSNIADYALQTQTLGGVHFSYNRMSWIKPNFLWMMYRCGWATKENQERVLAIWIDKSVFEDILSGAIFSSYQTDYYNDQEAWKQELAQKEVRLQWDPDHDPYGNKLSRRAIQLGMKGNVLKQFGQYKIDLIEDITSFVREQKVFVDKRQLDKLIIPEEEVFQPRNEALYKQFGIEK